MQASPSPFTHLRELKIWASEALLGYFLLGLNVPDYENDGYLTLHLYRRQLQEIFELLNNTR
jgi:hypothetical protein